MDDYNYCKACHETNHEEICYERCIDGIKKTICDNCIEEAIDDGRLIKIETVSDENDDGDNKNISYFGCIYKSIGNKCFVTDSEKIENAIKIINNVIYFDDSNDYLSALYTSLSILTGKTYNGLGKLDYIK